jgi:Delta14-sterol reductase
MSDKTDAQSLQGAASQAIIQAVSLIALPLFVTYLWVCIQHNHGAPVPPTPALLQYVPWPTATSVGIAVGWLAFQALLQVYAPGRWTSGVPLSDGTRLAYRMNGWLAWWITLATAVAGVATGLISPTIVADQLGPLLSTANIIAFLAAFHLFWRGRRAARQARALSASNETESAPAPYTWSHFLRKTGVHFSGKCSRTGARAISDFWLGRELNPRIGAFDLKLFCEARPGLIAWVLIDLSLAAKQHELHGYVSTPMLLVCAFQAWYVADYFFHEEAILTTWDIRHEKFGWMLCWGNLVWVPFTYTLQAQYLVEHAHDLPWWATAGIVLINVAGYAIFRGSNIQKHRFRQDPKRPIWGKPAAYIPTRRGALLLTSGFWGLARHLNYFGDLLMALAWSLPAGFGSPIPYFYPVYLTVLLVHRERRDNRSCRERYGKDWDAYCRRVPSRIIPGVY